MAEMVNCSHPQTPPRCRGAGGREDACHE